MKNFLTGMLGSLAVATTLVAAQAPKEQAKQQPAEVSVTGCVTQGSGPTVFILDNARMNAKDMNEKGKTYLLVAGTEDLMLRSHVNHEVTVTGTAESKMAPVPPAGQKINEKELPKFTAKSLTQVSDTCTTTAR